MEALSDQYDQDSSNICKTHEVIVPETETVRLIPSSFIIDQPCDVLQADQTWANLHKLAHVDCVKLACHKVWKIGPDCLTLEKCEDLQNATMIIEHPMPFEMACVHALTQVSADV